jgi:uncharacterized protein
MSKDLTELTRFIAADPGLASLLEEARARLTDDPGHDVAHCLRVAYWTIELGGDIVDRRSAVAAALLHDIVNLPKDSPERADASRRSAEVARSLLPSRGFSPRQVDGVADAILAHSYSAGRVPTTSLGEALQDADRLEALGALGIWRTASCGARMNASYFHAEDPWAAGRALDDRAFSVDHFFTKLLGLPKTMRTRAGRREALRRREHLVAFLRQLGSEILAPPPEEKLALEGGAGGRAEEQELVYELRAGEYERLVAAEDHEGNLLRELERIAPTAGARVLEVGAGTGRITRQLVARGAQVTGFDRAEPMLAIARQRLSDVPGGAGRWTLACADARDLPIDGPPSFDLAVAGWVFGHFRLWMPANWQETVARAIAEMERCVVPGGSVVVIETLGTGSAEPRAPSEALAEYYAWLEERGFARTAIRTDYRFADVDAAAEATRVFFGQDMAERVRRERWAQIPECTGVWSKKTRRP